MTAETKKANNHCYCKFCKAEGIKRVATLMTKYAGPRGREHSKHFSCHDHVHLMEDTDPNRDKGEKLKALREQMKNSGRDEHMTEADYQTWGRL